MRHSNDPRRPRGRRSPGGRMLTNDNRRARPTPAMLRPAQAQPGLSLAKLLSIALLTVGALIVFFMLSGVGMAYGAYSQLADSLKPRLAELQNAESFQTTKLYDRNGVLLYEFFGAGKRTRVPLAQVSTALISATVAIEDKTFFENTGVDYEGILKAGIRSLSAGEETGGASTITQQLIRGVVLTDEERTYENRYQRKLTEIILAQELAERYSKEEILELYLNEIYYGNLAYGIEAASNVYFDRSADNLTLGQSALLAGLPQLPNVYDPFLYTDGGVLQGIQLGDGWLDLDYELPENITPPKWRQIAVLRQMVDEGFLPDQLARRAAAEDLHFASQEVPLNAPHFVFYVRRQLEEKFGPQFANQGLSIYTSIDLNLQRMVQETAAERIAELEERNIHNAAVVVMQPNTGQILAMVGSIDYNKIQTTTTPGEQGNVVDGQVNVTVRERQPGSALKPFTYLAAMEQGMTPATVIWDVPTKFPLSGGEWYEPKNYNGRWNGPVRMRGALANSLNMPAVKALKFAGIDHTIDLLHRAGISSLRQGEGYYGLALTLGGGAVTPLELTTAYNTLASGGRYYPPLAILKVVTSDGKILQQYVPTQRSQTLNPEHVAIITDIMSDDKAREPIWGLNSKLKLSRPAAVKTGTSNDWRDAWAVGFTPYVTVGVWTGNNNNEETKKVESLTGGGVIWHNIMESLFTDPRFQKLLAEPYPGGQLPLNFAMPQKLTRKPICRLPGPFSNYNQELFSPGMRNTQLITSTLPAGIAPEPASARGGCDIYTEITVAQIGTTDIAASGTLTDTLTIIGTNYCRPTEGVVVPPELLTTIYAWNLPPSDPSERIEYRWEGVGGSLNGKPIMPVRADLIPPCSAESLTPFTPPSPGSIQMPDLRGLGENQAKEQLGLLGITNVYVDYQTRERIPDVYDQVGPYVVVSTLPLPGDWLAPDSIVVLGIRAPE